MFAMQNLDIYNQEYYKRELAEYWFTKHDLLRPDQLAALCYAHGIPFFGESSSPRSPKLIYSIGCGAGDLEKKLEDMGHEVIGVDPSEGAKHLYKGSKLIDRYEGGGDTIIFCESIEHLPIEEIRRIFSLIPLTARIIIVNWPDYHPLYAEPESHDHITEINDDLYAELSTNRNVILRRGSHLVLQ